MDLKCFKILANYGGNPVVRMYVLSARRVRARGRAVAPTIPKDNVP